MVAIIWLVLFSMMPRKSWTLLMVTFLWIPRRLSTGASSHRMRRKIFSTPVSSSLSFSSHVTLMSLARSAWFWGTCKKSDREKNWWNLEDYWAERERFVIALCPIKPFRSGAPALFPMTQWCPSETFSYFHWDPSVPLLKHKIKFLLDVDCNQHIIFSIVRDILSGKMLHRRREGFW